GGRGGGKQTTPPALPADEPFLENVGDPFRPAIDHPMAARGTSDIEQIAQSHLLPARHAQECLVERLAAMGLRNFRYRGVKRITREVEMQTLRENRQRLGFVDLHPTLQQ